MSRSFTISALAACVSPLVCCNVALAGSISVTPISIDKTDGPEVVELPGVTVTFGSNLAYQDVVTVSLIGAETTVADGYPPLPLCQLASSPTPQQALGLISLNANSWIFRVGQTEGIVQGDTCTFSGLKIARSSIGETCNLAISYQAKTFIQNVVIDSGGPADVANVTPCGPPPPQIIEVGLDVKPGAVPNAINVSSKGNIPVAILSSGTFYAPGDVDLSFPLMFGGMSMQPSLIRCNAAGEDVNYDGYVDLVCHFATPMTGFAAGDTVGFLLGRAKNGAYVVGQDSVRILK